MTRGTLLAVLLPTLIAAALLATWIMLREIRKRYPDATRRERTYHVFRAWETAGLSLMTVEKPGYRRCPTCNGSGKIKETPQ